MKYWKKYDLAWLQGYNHVDLSSPIIRVYANRTQAKKIIAILILARFSGKGRHTLHYDLLCRDRDRERDRRDRSRSRDRDRKDKDRSRKDRDRVRKSTPKVVIISIH